MYHIITVFTLFPFFLCAQNGFYLGAGSITTIAQLSDQNNYYEAWNVSYKYSSYLIKKINHKDIHILCYRF